MRALISSTEATANTIVSWLVANVGPIDRDSATSGSGWHIVTSTCGVTSVNLTDDRYATEFQSWINTL